MKMPNVELSVRLSDGTFEAKMSVPLDAPKDVRDAATERWLAAMREILAVQIVVTPGGESS